jgi:hypothetical protein
LRQRRGSDRASLEDIFIDLVERAPDAAAAA